jgi:uncharacterized protein YyaL (SSP411 family)
MGPAFIVVIAGQEGRDGTEVLINTLKNEFTPNIILVLKDEHDDRLEEIMDLQEKEMLDGKATAYVCGGGTCYAPVTEPAHLGEILGLKKFS